MKRSIIALSILAATTTCQASDLFVSVEHGLFTKHFVERSNGLDWNENNKLIGFELGYNDFSLQYSEFNNSYGNDSYTIGLNYNVFDFHGLVFGIGAGAVNGYTGNQNPLHINGSWGAYVAPSIAYDIELYKGLTVSPVVRLFGEAVVGTIKVTYKF